MMKPRPRIIPILLWRGEGLVKTENFQHPTYLGDPINAVRIYNDSEVDELILVDITPGLAELGPRFEKLSEMTTECFMPLCYGGGIRNMNQVEKLIKLGIEKVSFNTAAFRNPELVRESARVLGTSSVVVSVDVKKGFWGGQDVVVDAGKTPTKIDPVTYAKRAEDLGAGEILLTSIDHEGTRRGYDLPLIEKVSKAVRIPVVAHGGAGTLQDMKAAIQKSGASAAAAGSLFVYHGKLKGILINYPRQSELKGLFGT